MPFFDIQYYHALGVWVLFRENGFFGSFTSHINCYMFFCLEVVSLDYRLIDFVNGLCLECVRSLEKVRLSGFHIRLVYETGLLITVIFFSIHHFPASGHLYFHQQLGNASWLHFHSWQLTINTLQFFSRAHLFLGSTSLYCFLLFNILDWSEHTLTKVILVYESYRLQPLPVFFSDLQVIFEIDCYFVHTVFACFWAILNTSQQWYFMLLSIAFWYFHSHRGLLSTFYQVDCSHLSFALLVGLAIVFFFAFIPYFFWDCYQFSLASSLDLNFHCSLTW